MCLLVNTRCVTFPMDIRTHASWETPALTFPMDLSCHSTGSLPQGFSLRFQNWAFASPNSKAEDVSPRDQAGLAGASPEPS